MQQPFFSLTLNADLPSRLFPPFRSFPLSCHQAPALGASLSSLTFVLPLQIEPAQSFNMEMHFIMVTWLMLLINQGPSTISASRRKTNCPLDGAPQLLLMEVTFTLRHIYPQASRCGGGGHGGGDLPCHGCVFCVLYIIKILNKCYNLCKQNNVLKKC